MTEHIVVTGCCLQVWFLAVMAWITTLTAIVTHADRRCIRMGEVVTVSLLIAAIWMSHLVGWL